MRVLLNPMIISGLSIDLTTLEPRRWIIRERPSSIESMTYIYLALDDDDTKFFEDGVIYNADGSVADNKLKSMNNYFHGVPHASLNKLLSQPVVSPHRSFLYGLGVGKESNLRRILVVRDRLNVPDWVALLIVAKVIDEDTVNMILTEVSDLFDVYPLDWVLNVLHIKPADINGFDAFDIAGLYNTKDGKDNFDDFCKIIELEKQYASSVSKVGAV